MQKQHDANGEAEMQLVESQRRGLRSKRCTAMGGGKLIILILLLLGSFNNIITNVPELSLSYNSNTSTKPEEISWQEIALLELMDDSINCSAAYPLAPFTIKNRILDRNLTHNSGRKIPRVIHMLSTVTRCATKPIYDNAEAWKRALPGHSFVFHDRQAVDALLSRSWPEFLNIRFKDLVKCSNNHGAGISDLVRLLVLYEYGGIYVDTDDGPGSRIAQLLSSNETIDSEMIVLERIGEIVQALYLAIPRHPFLHYAIMEIIKSQLELEDIGKAYIPTVTGPASLNRAFAKFDRDRVAVANNNNTMNHGRHYGKMTNHSIDIFFSGNNRNWYFKIENVKRADKAVYYDAISGTDYNRDGDEAEKEANGLSCFDVLLIQ